MFNTSEEQVLVQSALNSLEKIEVAFNQLIENKQQSGNTDLEVRQELNERLTGQISVELQRLLKYFQTD
ncbi:MAG: hypothetical protein HC797_01825 [Anaerolineales bacterium]|nr:hypothetical protein [Anaerolineales bacterium]